LFWASGFGKGLWEIGFLSIPEVGWKTVSCVEQSPLWTGVSAEVKVFLFHRDVVLSLGDSLVSLAVGTEVFGLKIYFLAKNSGLLLNRIFLYPVV
jgi:hypothetical protein